LLDLKQFSLSLQANTQRLAKTAIWSIWHFLYESMRDTVGGKLETGARKMSEPNQVASAPKLKAIVRFPQIQGSPESAADGLPNVLYRRDC
jgi:hypothetical protein